MIKRIILCTLGSVFFGVTMRVNKKSLIFIFTGALMTSAISIGLYERYGDFLPCLSAMLALSVYSEICAKKLKQPTTVILLPSAIPLLPGSYIYYCMLFGINGDRTGFIEYGKATVLTGLGIAVGTVLSSIITGGFNALYHRCNIRKILRQTKALLRRSKDG